VRTGQPDVDDQHGRTLPFDVLEQLRAGCDRLGREPLLAEPAPQHGPQLVVVLDNQNTVAAHSSRSVAPRGMRLMARAAIAPAKSVPRTPAAPSSARNLHGIARWSGGGPKTCWSIATSLGESRHPSSAARGRAATSTSAASLHRNAAACRTEAP